MTVITSTRNDTVRRVASLVKARHRRETGLIVIEGPNLFEAAVEAGTVFDTVLVTADDTTTMIRAERSDIRVTVVTDRVLASAADAQQPRSPIASIVRPEDASLDHRNTVVLVGIADPGNAGTIIRTAAAFGFAVAVSAGSVDVWSPKTLRSGAGAHFHTAITTDIDLASVTAVLPMVATVPSGGTDHLSARGPVAVLVGSEAHGLPQEWITGAQERMTIPIDGSVESLNAAVAAGIAMYRIAGAG